MEYHPHPQQVIQQPAPQSAAPAPTQQKIVYVQGPPPQRNEGQALGVATTAAVAEAAIHHQHVQPSAPPSYNPSAVDPNPSQPLVPQQAAPAHQQQYIQQVPPPKQQHVQMVQPVQAAQPAQPQHAGGLTQEQHNYVQPKQEPKIVYKEVEKIVYVDKKDKEAEALIHKQKQQKQEPPPPESGGCCCTIL